MEFKQSVVSLFDSPFTLHELRIGITKAIEKSFEREKMNVATHAEVKRRFDVCMNWALILRGDLKWGVARVVGAMDEILKAELAGNRYAPSDRQVWVQADGA